ncbi:hypothetical protein DY000_02047810 [Brassica cretica]|uniref:Uncharacterized protein n=1 Tax=Brassica cretica TaxID=69181 RepID=A0ABQ7EQA7_BRACR|nr:hypothetical protein DY000_02047810 [Brassica cretica]
MNLNSGKHGLSLLRSLGDSIRSDRVGQTPGRYVATELWLELGRYVATERDERSVSTWRPSGTSAWSLRSDRAGRVLGRYVATELWLEQGDRALARARLLHSNRAGRSLDRYVATEL